MPNPLTLDYEVVIYSHRPHVWQPIAAEAWARLTTETLRLTIIREPGTAAQNLNRGLDICRSRYLFLADEDCILFQTDWVAAMLAMTGAADFGLGGCREMRTPEERDAYDQAAVIGGPCQRVPRLPGYVHLIDTLRCRGLRFDENLPGKTGMSDTDMCAQVRHVKGLGVYQHQQAAVYHPAKVDEDGWRKAHGHDLWTEQQRWYPEQVAYMDAKYGKDRW